MVTRGSRTWTWSLAEVQESRLSHEGPRLRGPDVARLPLHELAREAIHRLREAVVPGLTAERLVEFVQRGLETKTSTMMREVRAWAASVQ